MSNETVERNCLQHLHVKNMNIVNEEINNNNISIDTRERTNNNTVIIIRDTNFESKKNESYCEKAVQMVSELETSPYMSVDKTKNMDKDRNDSNNFSRRNSVNYGSKFKNVETKDNEIVTTEEFQTIYSELNTRINNEMNITQGTSRNVTENKCTRPQKLSVSDEQYVDKSMPVNNPILDSSQITQLSHQSDRYKAIFNIVTNFMSTYSKNSSQFKIMDTFTEMSSSNKFKQILDRICKEAPNVETAQEKNAHAWTQTEDVQNSHKITQTDSQFANEYYNNCTTNMGLNCVMLKEFIRESKIYFKEFQNKLHYLFQQCTNQNNNENDKLDNQITFFDEGANTNEKVDDAVVNNDNAGIDNNVRNRSMAVDIEHLATNTNNSRHVDTIGNGVYAGNRANNNAVTDTNNNEKAYNTVNPMPRQGSVLQGEQTPVMQPGFSGNHAAQTKAGRPRNEMSNTRYSPYSRQQFWQQEFNSRHRQVQHLHECPNNGMQAQHNSMLRQFNGWQTPNAPNHQSLFNPHHHHHHHF